MGVCGHCHQDVGSAIAKCVVDPVTREEVRVCHDCVDMEVANFPHVNARVRELENWIRHQARHCPDSWPREGCCASCQERRRLIGEPVGWEWREKENKE